MQGRRLPDTRAKKLPQLEPGDYQKVAQGDVVTWYARPPEGPGGPLFGYQVEEHEDETITVAPAILFPNMADPEHNWLGFLEAGQWRTA